jgi:hypothetical protein
MDANGSTRPSLDFAPETPIYDRDGSRLGVVAAEGLQEQYLMMKEGKVFHHDVAVPISAIDRVDAAGIHLNRTRREIEDLTLGGWSSLGDVDLDTGEAADDMRTPGG